LECQPFHDPTTGLANRILCADRLGHALNRRQRAPYDIGVLFIDLDHVKVVNDTLGHPAGDALLLEAARRIASEVRNTDTVRSATPIDGSRTLSAKKRTGGPLVRANLPVRSTPGLTKRRQGPRAAATFGVLTDLAV